MGGPYEEGGMIAGRPTNLWLGLATALGAAIQVTLVTLGYDAVAVATIIGAFGGVAGAAIMLIANQPPTLQPGDAYKIVTPSGTPNYEATVAPPPAPTKPTVEPGTN